MASPRPSVELYNLRDLADTAKQAGEQELSYYFSSGDRAYARGIEDVLRWLAGDTEATPELLKVIGEVRR